MQKLFGAGLIASCALFWACGTTSTASKVIPDAGTDAGPTDGGTEACTVDLDCSPGVFCVGGTCGNCMNPSLHCPSDTMCSNAGQCIAVDAGSKQDAGPVDAGKPPPEDAGPHADGGSCIARTSCPTTQACLCPLTNECSCGTAPADAGCTTDNECNKEFICNSGHQCVPGCSNNNDCHGTNFPTCIIGGDGGNHCGACSKNTDCLSSAGETCQSGQCVGPTSCTSPLQCGNEVCLPKDGGGGLCGACNVDGPPPCPTNTHCDPSTLHCLAGPGSCTSDLECQTENGSPAWYCSTDAGCQVGCVADSKCTPTPIQGCCNLQTSTCDTTTHQCATKSGSTGTTAATTGSTGTTGTTSTTSCDCTALDCANLGETCDVVTCACKAATTGSTGTAGSTGATGTTSCDCASLMCSSLGLTCDSTSCSCVSATTGANGNSGTTGANGTSGLIGNIGLSGSGTSGLIGNIGLSGSGSSGLIGNIGLSGSGSSGLIGNIGLSGSSGTSGTSGSSGCSLTIDLICLLLGETCDSNTGACSSGGGTTGGTGGSTGGTGGCGSLGASGQPCEATCACNSGLQCENAIGEIFTSDAGSQCAQNIADNCADNFTCK